MGLDMINARYSKIEVSKTFDKLKHPRIHLLSKRERESISRIYFGSNRLIISLMQSTDMTKYKELN